VIKRLIFQKNPYRNMQQITIFEFLIKICIELHHVSMGFLIDLWQVEEKNIEENNLKEKITKSEPKLFSNWLNEWWDKADEKYRNWHYSKIYIELSQYR
jgi:hypothetical protein